MINKTKLFATTFLILTLTIYFFSDSYITDKVFMYYYNTSTTNLHSFDGSGDIYRIYYFYNFGFTLFSALIINWSVLYLISKFPYYNDVFLFKTAIFALVTGIIMLIFVFSHQVGRIPKYINSLASLDFVKKMNYNQEKIDYIFKLPYILYFIFISFINTIYYVIYRIYNYLQKKKETC